MLKMYHSMHILLHHFIIYYRKTQNLTGLWIIMLVFNQLKHALVHAPVLAIPDFNANFEVETDASDMAVGAVLMQHDWPFAFISKVLNSAQCNYHTKDCKLLAIVFACKRWHPYLDGKTIISVNRSQTFYRTPHST